MRFIFSPIQWMSCMALCLLCAISASAQEWSDFAFPVDAAPVDLSRFLDAPAGKHGFLGVNNGRFEFEDGTAIRFWGTTLTGSACFPPQDFAPRLADRLAKYGFNLVRFHMMDAAWSDPPLVQYDDRGVLELNPVAMDRLDFFLIQLQNRGIYACFDGLDARVLDHSAGLPYADAIPPGWKGLIHYTPELRRRFVEFLDRFWTHRNAYAGWNNRVTEYRDSPAIAMILLMDENTIAAAPRPHPYFTAELEKLWPVWREENHLDEAGFDLNAQDAETVSFLSETTARSLIDFFNVLRELGVKAPIAGTNLFLAPADLKREASMDYVAAGALWNPPFAAFKGYPNQRMTDVNPLAAPALISRLAYARLSEKPFVAMSWGEPWPNETRAELPLWLAAAACAQDWQGCVGSTCASVNKPALDFIPAPFEAGVDPARFGVMPAAALLFHRRDVEPLSRRIAMGLAGNVYNATEGVSPDEARPPRLAERVRVETRIDSRPSGRNVLAPTQPEKFDELLERNPPNPALRHDPARGLVSIDAPRVQAVIGRINQAAPHDLSGLMVESGIDFAVVCAVSLDDRPLAESADVWLTVLSDARNTGFASKPAPQGRLIDSIGKGPIQLRRTPVRVFLKTHGERWTVEAIGADGRVLERLPYQVVDGMLSIRAGTHATMWYRLRQST